ncbi:LptF/LptG family permease [Candidatus Pelagibacter sp.]|nr:LptF/LptG family permease [Candidatus Pelagibacter sp.]
MFKIYEKYLIKNFLGKFFLISFVFLSLIIILSILEEISFFKNLETSFFFPYFLTLLGAPITLFEIFPFIFLLSTQFLFYDLFKKDELILLKSNGLSNLKIIRILFISSMLMGVLTVSLYYSLASKLKFYYTDIKNNFSNDNKYLAVVTDSGLWLKDEINNNTLIVKANYIKDNFLIDVIINKFDDNFNLIDTVQANEVDIIDKDWVIKSAIITKDNITQKNENISLKTNFNQEKINSLFSNISTLNLLELFDLKKDYEKLGYSSDEIIIHLLKLFSTPLLYGILTVLSSIIMFNFKREKSIIFHVILGIFMSVMIYYLNFIFTSLGNTGKIPIIYSIFMPLLFISLIATIGLIRVNEK